MKIAAQTAVTAALGAAAVALAVGAAGAAGASTADDAFIGELGRVGIGYDSPQEAVKDGHRVCWYLAAGKNGTDVAMMVLSQTNLTPKLAALFVVESTRAYCPQLSGQL
jgi:Protein of unknown function (DUF732)